MDFYIAVSLFALTALLNVAVSLPTMKVLQKCGYSARGFIASEKADGYDLLIRHFGLMIFGAIAVVIFVSCFGAYEYAKYCAAILYIGLCVIFIYSSKKDEEKIVLSRRFAAVMAVDAALSLIVCGLILFAVNYNPFCQVLVAILSPLSPLLVMAASYIVTPFAFFVNKNGVEKAKELIKQKSPTVICVSGTLSGAALNVLGRITGGCVIGAHNTTKGLADAICSCYDGRQYLIADVPARYKNEAKKFCDILNPNYAVLFGLTYDVVKQKTFYDHIANMTEIANRGCSLVAINGALNCNGKELNCKTAVVTYSDFTVSDNVNYKLNVDGEIYDVSCNCVSALMAECVSACAVIAAKAGIKKEEIERGINEALSDENFMRIKPAGNLKIIDNSDNSDVMLSKAAVNELSRFEQKKAIVISSVPCRVKGYIASYASDIADVCDYCYCYGKKADVIKKSVTKAGMNENDVFVFDDIDAALSALKNTDLPIVALVEGK